MLPIGERIRNLRRVKNETQEDLALVLGVTYQAVSRWEKGDDYPDIELLP
ncbi:MAG: helix-turn-helix transcriptional regulator, partial [Clostridia bacterium]|nr:helix-turn-helix transcriptional regulator [Clostridia bacterium]